MVFTGHPAFVSSLLLVNVVLNHAAVEIKFSLHAAAQSWAIECKHRSQIFFLCIVSL